MIDFARKAGVNVKISPEAVQRVATIAFPTPAKRPLNSRLNTNKLKTTFEMDLPDWQRGVTRMLTEILEK